MFVGSVPPGKAPWHYHLYEEVVVILSGTGRLHWTEGSAVVEPGTAFRLRAREPHVVENTGSGPLELLGVFTPAGSPAAAYLALEDFGS